MKGYLLLILFLGFRVLGNCQTENSRGYLVKVGDACPNFELTDTEGNTYDLASVRGKVVMLQFTASWCGVCRREMPHIEKEIWQAQKDEDFVLIGVDYDESLEKVKSFARDIGITYPIAPDPGGAIFHKFAAPKAGVTRNVILDQSGNIIFLTRLFDAGEFEQMKVIITETLK